MELRINRVQISRARSVLFWNLSILGNFWACFSWQFLSIISLTLVKMFHCQICLAKSFVWSTHVAKRQRSESSFSKISHFLPNPASIYSCFLVKFISIWFNSSGKKLLFLSIWFCKIKIICIFPYYSDIHLILPHYSGNFFQKKNVIWKLII